MVYEIWAQELSYLPKKKKKWKLEFLTKKTKIFLSSMFRECIPWDSCYKSPFGGKFKFHMVFEIWAQKLSYSQQKKMKLEFSIFSTISIFWSRNQRFFYVVCLEKLYPGIIALNLLLQVSESFKQFTRYEPNNCHIFEEKIKIGISIFLTVWPWRRNCL